jgi:hypothetical protein
MNNTNMENRIAALEKRIGADAIATLHLDGGVTHRISASPTHFFALLEASRSMPCDAELGTELDWIRRAERIEEDGHLIEILSAMLAGPVSRGEINPD